MSKGDVHVFKQYSERVKGRHQGLHTASRVKGRRQSLHTASKVKGRRKRPHLHNDKSLQFTSILQNG